MKSRRRSRRPTPRYTSVRPSRRPAVQTRQGAGVTQILLLTHLILLTFTIKDWCLKVRFQKKQSRFASAVFDSVLTPPHQAWHIWRCPWFSVHLETTHEASRGPLKGAVSAQKALQLSWVQDRDEGVAGMSGIEKYPLDEESLVCPPGKPMIFHKKEAKNNLS